MPVIGRVAASIATMGVPSRFARVLAWVALIIVAGLLVWGAWTLWSRDRDQDVIARDRDAARIETLRKTVAADRGAGAAKNARDRAFANEQAQLQEKADDAAANGVSPLDALFDQLR